MHSRVVFEIVDSEALRGNALGDSTARRAAIWLPPSYDREPGRRYPVVYWLAGFTGTGEMLFQGSPWQPGMGERLDRLTTSGAMGEIILVAPDCFTRLGGSQYLDSPATGRYETHLIEEVIPHIDRRFRTRPSSIPLSAFFSSRRTSMAPARRRTLRYFISSVSVLGQSLMYRNSK